MFPPLFITFLFSVNKNVRFNYAASTIGYVQATDVDQQRV